VLAWAIAVVMARTDAAAAGVEAGAALGAALLPTFGRSEAMAAHRAADLAWLHRLGVEADLGDGVLAGPAGLGLLLEPIEEVRVDHRLPVRRRRHRRLGLARGLGQGFALVTLG